jgi:hypothetical protein
MDKLVLDHKYNLGIAWDQTKFRNHGIVHQAVPGSGYLQGSFSFAPGRTWPGSAVVVPPARSLRKLGALRVRASILTVGKGGGASRQNILEAHLSFAVFVNPDLSLQATFVSPANRWTGLRTGPRAIVPDKWFQVEFWYDGISAAQILVDGVVQASSLDAASQVDGSMGGPVRGVGPHGIFIGHWPEKDDRYTFEGFIRDVQVYKRDDEEDLLKLMDPCCARDLRDFYDVGERLRDQGYDLQDARSVLEKIIGSGTELIASWRGESEEDTRTLNDMLAQFLFALSRRNSLPIEPSLLPLLEWVAEHADMDQLAEAGDRVEEILEALPLTQDELLDFGNKLCFAKFRGDIEEEVKRLDKDPRWNEIRKRHIRQQRPTRDDNLH